MTAYCFQFAWSVCVCVCVSTEPPRLSHVPASSSASTSESYIVVTAPRSRDHVRDVPDHVPDHIRFLASPLHAACPCVPFTHAPCTPRLVHHADHATPTARIIRIPASTAPRHAPMRPASPSQKTRTFCRGRSFAKLRARRSPARPYAVLTPAMKLSLLF